MPPGSASGAVVAPVRTAPRVLPAVLKVEGTRPGEGEGVGWVVGR